MTPPELLAKEFAKEKHGKQTRKFSTELYHNHPERVALIVKKLTGDIDLVIAGYLHDTLEDTKTTFIEIDRIFGKRIADLVFELTNDNKKMYFGKVWYMSRKLRKMSDDALIVKLCDILDNVQSSLKINHLSEARKFTNRYDREILKMISYIEKKRKLKKIHILLIKKIKEAVKKNEKSNNL